MGESQGNAGFTMHTRPMTEDEVLAYFGDADQRGIIAQEGERVVGWTGWNTADGVFYAHSTFCDDEHPHAYVALVQELRRLCRASPFDSIRFYVDADNEWYLDRVRSIKGVKAVRHVFDLEVR